MVNNLILKYQKQLIIFSCVVILFSVSSLLRNKNNNEELKNFSKSDIARFTISNLFYKESRYIRTYEEKIDGEMVYLAFYVRNSDYTTWGYKVKFDGNRVIWGGIYSPYDGYFNGRWRDSNYDEVNKFEEINHKIKMTTQYSDGYVNTKYYHIGD